jgi:hypothetical protein
MPVYGSIDISGFSAGVIVMDKPRNRSWTGWSVRFLGCRARHNDAEWLFHSKEL